MYTKTKGPLEAGVVIEKGVIIPVFNTILSLFPFCRSRYPKKVVTGAMFSVTVMLSVRK